MSSFFSTDLHKFKLETQLKTLTHIVDEKQVEIKDAITVISSLNTFQKLLVSEVLKLVKLILTVPTANAASERSCSTLRRFKTHLRLSMTQELLSFSYLSIYLSICLSIYLLHILYIYIYIYIYIIYYVYIYI